MNQAQEYFPPPDAQGGWRQVVGARDMRRSARLDPRCLEAAGEYVRTTTPNGGLLVTRHGWLALESYFGLGCRDAAANLASCGKPFTSIAVGILMAERPQLFPDGLEQRVFTRAFFPETAFPLSDPARAGIKLGQLLSFTAGIRGNNPCSVNGLEVLIDPTGPDGWQAMVDDVALGRRDEVDRHGRRLSTASLWCAPGEGYSYATSSVHLASMMLRHVTGLELEAYLGSRIAGPLGWGSWGFGYRMAKDKGHTPGGGGIAVRATDMLRFAYLLLHQGRWGDRQLVPRAYVEHCGSSSPYNPHTRYSLQFELNSDGHLAGAPNDAFWKTGAGGHALYVVPSLDLVAWKLGGKDHQYDPADTGIPAPTPVAEPGAPGPRAAVGAPFVPEAEAALRTLQLVVAAAIES